MMRLHADAQNIRRRAEQDIEKAHKYGQERLLSELLPVIDNLERALQASGTDDNELLLALKQGVELTLKSFVDCLRKFNVEMLDPVGEPFDPLFHQAIAMVESKTSEPESVLSVMQKGYSLNGRVLRPAMVVVARAPAASIDTRA
jgi:molecular chaperone GrpE